MLLKKLKEYADERMEDPLPPLYSMTPVAHIVALDSDGRPLSPQPISRIDPSTTRGKRGQEMAAPVVNRSSGLTPLLLADNGQYTFGQTQDDKPEKQQRAEKEHAAYREVLDRCAAWTQDPAVLAVQRFYEHGGADQLDLGDEWDYKLKITFRVQLGDGTACWPIDLLTVQNFWLSEHAPGTAAVGQCLVCREYKPVLDRLQAKVKGIRGGQSSGTALISANSKAFESYGLEASKIAPTCQECGEGFTRALNHLLSNDHSRIVVGNATFVFWTRQSVAFDFRSHMHEPDAAEVRTLLESVRTGRRAALGNDSPFYAAALSASGGRAVVRDWIDTTVDSVARNVARWFVLQQITDPRDEDPAGDNPKPLSLFQLAASTVASKVRDVGRDLPVTTPRSLLRSALAGTPLPLDLAYQAVRRCRAERSVTRPRAALIKLVLLSQESQQPKEDYMVALEPGHPSAAYHCGRLLAVLQSVQQAALPGVNATIVDRYYGAASSTPATVFGALMRGARPHLTKLKRDRPGAHVNLQRDIEDVCDQIADWPATLPLKDQALFSLGYYHQRKHDRAEANARRAARDSQPGQGGINAETETKKENPQ